MTHFTTADFWACYNQLPETIRRLADANYELLRDNPSHPSLHFKRVGEIWSVRVTKGIRALAIDGQEGPIWFWIGSHDEYERIIANEM